MLGDHVQFMEDGYLAASGEIDRIDIGGVTVSVRLKDGSHQRLMLSELRFISSREQRDRANQTRRMQQDMLKSVGLRKVRGGLGGTFWE